MFTAWRAGLTLASRRAVGAGWDSLSFCGFRALSTSVAQSGAGGGTRPPRLAVFGGTGFAGRHIAEQWAQHAGKGASVVVAGRSLGKLDACAKQLTLPKGTSVDTVVVDGMNASVDDMAEALAGTSSVVISIGRLSSGTQPGTSFDYVHVEHPRAIAQACAKAGVEQLVLISAIGADSASPLTYHRTKGLGEEAVLDAFPAATVVRPSIIFGPGDNFFVRFATFAKYLPALPLFGGGATKFEPIHVKDLGECVARILSMPAGSKLRGKVVEAGGPDVLTWREMMKLVLDTTGHKRLLMPIPWALADFEARAIECTSRSLGMEPMVTREQMLMLRNDNVVRDPAAMKKLGLDAAHMLRVVDSVPLYLKQY